MKKLLVFILVLGLASNAWATAVSLIGPGTGPGSSGDPLAIDEALRIYLAVDVTGLEALSVTITSTGSGVTITGGVTAVGAEEYGVEVQDWGLLVQTDGGWQSGLSFDTAVSGGGTQAEIGLGHFGSTIYGATTTPVVVLPVAPGDLGGAYPTIVTANTPIAYIDVKGTGDGSITLSMADGSQFGDNTKDGSGNITGGFGDDITIYGIPEPATVALLGLGGLLLRRRR